jgi:predicted Rossmann fold flavoprotein
MRTIAVIGGGASGLAAGISAAREGASVTIFEGKDRPGKKLLATGNGKCNLSNLHMSAECYFGGSREWIEGCLSQFSVEDTIRFFDGMGLLLREKDGYLYPLCSQAAVVLELLREELKELGAELKTNQKVKEIYVASTHQPNQPHQPHQPHQPDQPPHTLALSEQGQKNSTAPTSERMFQLRIWDESQGREVTESFQRVILACGGLAAPKTGSDGSGYALAKSLGHRITPTFPALTPLLCKDTYCKQLAGVRALGTIRIWDGEECLAQDTGELQFTDYGLSGIPAFQVSRIVNQHLRKKQENNPQGVQPELLGTLDLLDQWQEGQEEDLLNKRLLLQGGRSVEAFFTGMIHQKLMKCICRLVGISADALVQNVDRKKLLQVFHYCRRLPFHIYGSGSFEQAQVTAGGVDVSEVTRQLESKLVTGVYFAGEILDVDGICGGYNLQWAWTSGYLAGSQAAK